MYFVQLYCLLHDLVEIDTGDHPIHLDHDLPAVALAEDAAAARIFGLLPADQAGTLLALWREFEAAETPDARFAKCLDHAQPILQVLRNPALLRIIWMWCATTSPPAARRVSGRNGQSFTPSQRPS
ncbi:MAG: HD domain-containing protein, partial [Gemmobacter sp.]|nr:HD domain-containing protein [Gemmobacter sp.]